MEVTWEMTLGKTTALNNKEYTVHQLAILLGIPVKMQIGQTAAIQNT